MSGRNARSMLEMLIFQDHDLTMTAAVACDQPRTIYIFHASRSIDLVVSIQQ